MPAVDASLPDASTRPRALSAVPPPVARTRPRILIVTQFYAPEPCAAANRVGALLTALGEAQFDVHVLTGIASFPDGIIAPGERLRFPRTTVSAGISVTRVPTYASPAVNGRSRLLNWLSVAAATAAYTLGTTRRYDYIFVTMPPITLALPALCALLRHRAKLIVDVRDVFPDVAIKMGAWRAGSPLARAVGWIAERLYRSADLVLCVTQSAYGEIVARGSDPMRTVLAPNGFDPVARSERSPYERKPGEFVAAFVGNMGLATGLDVILDAAAALRDDPSIRFVLAGGGADCARLTERIARERLANVVMLGVIPRADAQALVAEADACVVPLRAGIADSLPTKLFDALAVGCPVVCCADGEARHFVERSGGGIAVGPEDAGGLAAALRTLRADPARARALAESGRRYVAEHFDRARIMRAVTERLAHL